MNRLPYLLWALGAMGLLALSTPLIPSFQSFDPARDRGTWIDTLLRQTENHLTLSQPRSYFIHTDRTLYGQGGTIWGSAFVVRSVDHLPDSSATSAKAVVVSGRDQVMVKQHVSFVNGMGEISLTLPQSLPGGKYRLQLMGPDDEARTDVWFEKDITVHKPIYPRLRMKMELAREAYRPGDTAQAYIDLQTLQNNPLDAFSYEWTLRGQRANVGQGTGMTGKNGRDTLFIPLVDSLSQPELLLFLRIDYHGSPETITRSVHIQQDNLDLQFLPEGGTWIADHPQQLAFKALDQYGKGTDVRGSIYASSGVEVARFESFHKGMGQVNFTPEWGEQYVAKVEGIDREFPLPKVEPKAYGLSLHDRDADKLTFRLISPSAQSLHLLGRQRGRVYEAFQMQARAGVNYFHCPVDKFPAGAASFTLFDETGEPRAERLVFLHKDRQLRIEIEPLDKVVKPGSEAKARISVKDAEGNPAVANLSVAVVDTRNLSLANDKQPHLPAQLLLNSELKGEIEEPNFYFDPEEKHADKALDMLMLTQGWRRFVWDSVRKTRLDVRQERQFRTRVAGVLRYRKDGTPVHNAKITILHVDKGWWADEVRTDSLGYFAFEKPVSGLIHLQITGKKVTGKPIDLQLDQNAYNKLKGRVSRNYHYWGYRNDRSDIQLSEPPPATAQPSTAGVSPRQLGTRSVSSEVVTVQDKVSSASLEEVVVVGYAAQNARAVTGVVTRVASKELNGLNARNELAALTAGVVATSTSGAEPGEEGISIRGARSSGTVYYVDGVKIRGNTVLPIDPESIESVEIYRTGFDSYGAQGLGGVVSITTRNRLSRTRYNSWNVPRKGHFIMFDLLPAKPYVRQFYHGGYNSYREHYHGEESRITTHWDPVVHVDGEADISFLTPTTPTTFSISAMGVSSLGAVGQASETFANMPAFAVEAKVPSNMTVGESLSIPVTLTNNRHWPTTLSLSFNCRDSSLAFRGNPSHLRQIRIPPKQGKTIWLPFAVEKPIAPDHLYIRAKTTLQEQSTHHIFEVRPEGFPFALSVSGADSLVSETILMGDPVPQSVKVNFRAYADVLNQMQAGRDAMLRQPHGCFEQTSSSNFPNVLALHLMQSVVPEDQAFRKKAMNYIRKGHDRMKTFETPGHGFSLWGRNPANLHMSARGLLQFWWMGRVYAQTDQKVIARTQKWLLNRRNGQGRFEMRDHYRYHGSNLAPLYLHALVCFSLGKSGSRAIGPELDWMYHQVKQDPKAYTLALCSRALLSVGDTLRGRELVRLMMQMRGKEGLWQEKGRSAMGGYGAAFNTELNAICLLAALDSRMYSAAELAPSVAFLQTRRQHGRFGSTMTTVQVLEAFGIYQQRYKQTYGSGTMELWVDGQMQRKIEYTPEGVTELNAEDQQMYLSAGTHDIEVRQSGTGDMVPFSVDISGFARTPPSQAGCRVQLQQSLSNTQARAGDVVGLDISVRNLTDEPVSNPMLRVGIPSGVELALWQLKELQERGDIAYYETHAGELWLYLEHLDATEKRRFHLDLTATIPGNFTATASSAYLYYNDQHKHWLPGLALNIAE